MKSSIKLLELDRNELGNNREHPSSYDRNMCILQHMLIDDSFENRQSGRPKISDTHNWSKAAEIFKIIACGLTVSVPSIYFEFGTRNVLSWSTMVHPRQIATVPAPASSSKQICYPWITISATATNEEALSRPTSFEQLLPDLSRDTSLIICVCMDVNS